MDEALVRTLLQAAGIGLFLATARAVCTIHTMNSPDLIAELKADGWTLDRVGGSHHMFKHATKPGTVVVPHPKKDLGKGLVNAIRKQAGLK